MSLSELPVQLEDIERAARLLDGVIERTPVAHSRALSRELGSEVWLKAENLQRAGSFKARGAYVRMAGLSDQEKARGVIAASAGNHAQGVALAASQLGIRARIYMPRVAALPKIAATQDHGAEVVLFGSTVDEALSEAKRVAEESGMVFIHPFDNAEIVAGQGTLGLEILEQVPEVDTVLTGVGGGGLLAGLAVALKARAANGGRPVRLIGVQAENAAAYPPSLAGDAIVSLDRVSTIADGIAVGKPGELPFEIIRDLVDDVVTVSEDRLAEALIFLLERNKLVVEPAGVVGVAALLDGRLQEVHGDLGTTAVVLSGGNIDPMLMLKVIQRGLAAAGRYQTLKMMLVDRPGELTRISGIISSLDANVTGVDHTRIGGSLSMGDVSITIDMETKGHEHSRAVIAALEAEGYEPVVVH
ncbi:threonine ammonia-lyase [Kocuria palustris]|jgi:threonine dehydratase|uniref:threonine ammonia-lyase n=1 Tax=Kocuria palustris TaxID=71999 RepID=UPI0019D29A41|nr:threonine ammonia-lyase [Kocuria palustris]MBN6752763.1 threonine ammonia-lyase [Kocuria palustris]MBN6757718.1 threonine ammonia-lyase [Kocuria palustris]MBN6762746.1 threonine ammonia-lyase [Kocuria palustris]MBN6782228.1 threonine ammonia-lyase [Kocuria palustris]MBN6798663.1 threonine ammonia-lyase [Kocuria palustris]